MMKNYWEELIGKFIFCCFSFHLTLWSVFSPYWKIWKDNHSWILTTLICSTPLPLPLQRNFATLWLKSTCILRSSMRVFSIFSYARSQASFSSNSINAYWRESPVVLSLMTSQLQIKKMKTNITKMGHETQLFSFPCSNRCEFVTSVILPACVSCMRTKNNYESKK